MAELEVRRIGLELELDVELRDVLPGGVSSVAFAACKDECDVVVKCYADEKTAAREVKALGALEALGIAPRVVGWGAGVMILERVVPGTPLRSYAPVPGAALTAAGELLGCLFGVPAPADAQLLADREKADVDEARRFIKQIDPSHPGSLSAEALEGIVAEADELDDPGLFCHGDYQGGNILKQAQRWVLIDPCYVVGDPAIDAARLSTAVAVADGRKLPEVLATVCTPAEIDVERAAILARRRAAQACLYLAACAPENEAEAIGYRSLLGVNV